MRKRRLWRSLRIRLSWRAVQRATTWVALIAQASVGVPIGALARASDQQPSAPQAVKSSPPPPTPVVHVNRTVPNVTPPSARPTFSAQPTDAEITDARVFGEPLIAIGRGTLPGENRALASAVNQYLDARNPELVLPFLGFLKTYPDSPWRASLLLNLGLVYRRTGYFMRALDVWEQVWLSTKTGTDAKTRAIGDRALGELFALNARLGRFERLEALFAETKDRVVTGPATEQITAAREGLWMMRNTPERAFLCGPLAVDQVLAATRAGYVRDEKILQAKSTQQGTSLAQMQQLAADLNLPLQMAKRAPGAPVLLPAVMHWKAGHFAALIREAGGKYLVRDPTFGDELWVSRAALDEEATGYMLVKSQAWPSGWRAVEQAEGEQVWGKGQTDGNDPDQTHDDDEQAGGDGGDNSGDGDDNGGGGGGEGGGNGGDDGGNPNGDSPDSNNPDRDDDPDRGASPDDHHDDNKDSQDPKCGGMPRYSSHLMVVSLHLKDAPLGYFTPRGPSMYFTIIYNQREARQPQVFTFSNLGPKWTFKWLSYVEDDPTNPNASASVETRGGGRDTFVNFNGSTQSYDADVRTRVVLVRTSSNPIRYERRLAGGAIEVFAQPDGAVTVPRRVFLTEMRDKSGNAVTFTYDAQIRLIAATDALGQVVTLSYNEPSDSRKISRVTDPFGRFATFQYDGAGRLARIADVAGLQSSLTYDSGDFVTALTTPYGTARFAKGENGQDRWLEMTDPLGNPERVEYKSNAPLPASEPIAVVPAGIGVINNYLNYRNTFYWNKRAMLVAPRDPASAHRYHWLHTSGPLNQTSGALESELRPLEARLWYRYPGQASALFQGSSRRRTVVARVLDDGTTQAWKKEYNDRDRMTKRDDPLGREVTYVYASNGLDLLEKRQTTNGMNDLLLRYANYDAQHRPGSMTDAAGQTTTLTFNGAGQLTSRTNAKGEMTQYVYDTNGYLIRTVGAIAGAITTYTYDGFGRPRTVTNSDGYFVTTDYDALNRPTRAAFPDGTYEEAIYDRLDVAQRRDRLGRRTYIFHDALRRTVAVRDPPGRVTQRQWCGCGSLDAIVDGNGHRTSWDRDLQGRVVRAVRADGTTARTYVYEATTSRVKTITDAKLQVQTFTYDLDNEQVQIAYTNTPVATAPVNYSYETGYARLSTITDGAGTISITYKPFGVLGAGRVASIGGLIANDTVTYVYDELGRVATQTVNGNSIVKTYDGLGRVATENNTLGAFTFTYDGQTRRVSSIAYPNGQTANYTYLPIAGDRRLQTILHKRANGTTLAQFDYTYDAVGNIMTWQQLVGSNPAVLWRYTYDAADELLTAYEWSTTAPANLLKRYAYTYDSAANRATEQIDDQVTLSTYDAMNRLINQQAGGALRVAGLVSKPATVTIQGQPATVTADGHFTGAVQTTAGTMTFSVRATDASGNTRLQNYQITTTGPTRTFAYDANGNMTSDGTRTFEWNARDQLSAINLGSHRDEFLYNDLRERIQLTRKDSGTTTEQIAYVWCTDSQLCEERSSSGTTTRDTAFGVVRPSGANSFYLRDHVGTVWGADDSTATISDQYTYDPYGRRATVTGSNTLPAGFARLQPYADVHVDAAYGRFYDSGTARWLNEDPRGIKGGLNLYAYVANSPVKLIDPSGFSPWGWVKFWKYFKCTEYMNQCASSGKRCADDLKQRDMIEVCQLGARAMGKPEGELVDVDTAYYYVCFLKNPDCIDFVYYCAQSAVSPIGVEKPPE